MERKAVQIGIVVLVICCACGGIWSVPPNPESCALCGNGGSYRAPCVMNVSTGAITELAENAPGEGAAGEAEYPREAQVFRMAEGGKIGLDLRRRGNSRTCTAYLTAAEPVSGSLFCPACRKRLPGRGYVLLDLREPGKAVVFSVDGEAAEGWGEYRVIVTKQAGIPVVRLSTGPE